MRWNEISLVWCENTIHNAVAESQNDIPDEFEIKIVRPPPNNLTVLLPLIEQTLCGVDSLLSNTEQFIVHFISLHCFLSVLSSSVLTNRILFMTTPEPPWASASRGSMTTRCSALNISTGILSLQVRRHNHLPKWTYLVPLLRSRLSPGCTCTCTGSPVHQKSPHCDLEYTLAQGLRCASHCTAISNASLYRVSVVLFSHSTTCRVSVAPVAALRPWTHPYAGLGCATPYYKLEHNWTLLPLSSD